MLYLEIEQEVDSAHFLKLNYKSKCQNVHGHRWKFKVFIAANKTNENGMLVDFTLIKEVLKELDHDNLNKMDAFKDLNPTAENIAVVLSREIQDKLDLEVNKPVVYRIEVWETANNKVVWERDSE